ncbi:MAG TPA: HEAT repeat domain-containing protein, partial [Gemmataceae bacterium]|nr:HEAT repeat domain-containing protein [Gemmataceae bacterium]
MRLGQDVPLTDWLVALSHDSPFEQTQGRAAQGRTSPPLAAILSLLSLMEDADRGIRLRAVTALGDIAEEVRRLLPMIQTALKEAALNDGEDRVRAEAARALLRAGPQSDTPIAALVDALHSEVDVVRFHAAISLGDLGSDGRPAAADLIHTSFWDDDPAVRVEAATALWKIDRKLPLVLHVLVKALEDANELICWIAAERLAQLGSAAHEAIPALQHALQRDFRVSLIKKAVLLALERIDS